MGNLISDFFLLIDKEYLSKWTLKKIDVTHYLGLVLWLYIESSLGEHDIQYVPKSYKFKLLGKFVVQQGIRALFGRKSSVQTSPTHVYFPNLLSPSCMPKNGV